MAAPIHELIISLNILQQFDGVLTCEKPEDIFGRFMDNLCLSFVSFSTKLCMPLRPRGWFWTLGIFMKLLLRREQRQGALGLGKVVFSLHVRAQLSEDEKTAISKYKLGDTLLYEKNTLIDRG